MMESEAIERIERTPLFRYEREKPIHSDLFNALATAIKALEDVQQYRLIGTVEEYIDAVVKQEAKMVIGIHKANTPNDIKAYGKEALFGDCPVCGEVQNTLWNSRYCGDCGQALDWSVEE